jgi:hypothetical protein
MFDQLPGERGFDFVPVTTSLHFTVASGVALASIHGLPALPYDTVDAAMKVASTLEAPAVTGVEGLLALQRELGAALKGAGLGAELTPRVALLDRARPGDRRISEFALVQSLPGHDRYVPLGRWSLGDRQ